MNTQEAELPERQLTLDLVGPQIVMYRRYGNHMVPFKTKRVETKMYGVVHSRGSWLTTMSQRWRIGGFEINLFRANKHGFDAALKLLDAKPVVECYMGKIETHIPDPVELEIWVFLQLELKAFKRIK